MPTSDANLTCPECSSDLDVDEVDIEVGTLRRIAGCANCHWVPRESVEDALWRKAGELANDDTEDIP